MESLNLRFENLIAPCGMNCGVCTGYLRDKKPCSGCNESSMYKPQHCINCAIVHCESRASTLSGFCFECNKYPCKRLKTLDNRYREKYRMSMIENLNYIQSNGFEDFLSVEEHRWDCKNCGEAVSVHREECSACGSRV